ncbi:MAG TPA: hypothetical protein PLC48_07915 [Ferruginibacter sp.]|nr:hypothetical protein [Ferruginibacter sp.]
MIEIIAQALGYIASILLAISLMVNNDLKFRWLNTFGCLAFICYGILIHAFPVILTNTLLLLINMYYLIKIYRATENFDLLEFEQVKDDRLLGKFLSFYKADIHAYFPDYIPTDTGKRVSFVVLRDIVIANIFVAELGDNGIAEVKINYTVPKYRDYKVGKFIFEQEKKFLLSRGVSSLQYSNVHHPNHRAFIEKMGFTKNPEEGDNGYFKKL